MQGSQGVCPSGKQGPGWSRHSAARERQMWHRAGPGKVAASHETRDTRRRSQFGRSTARRAGMQTTGLGAAHTPNAQRRLPPALLQAQTLL